MNLFVVCLFFLFKSLTLCVLTKFFSMLKYIFIAHAFCFTEKKIDKIVNDLFYYSCKFTFKLTSTSLVVLGCIQGATSNSKFYRQSQGVERKWQRIRRRYLHHRKAWPRRDRTPWVHSPTRPGILDIGSHSDLGVPIATNKFICPINVLHWPVLLGENK